MTRLEERPPGRDVLATFLLALVARLLVASLVREHFPPADDGLLYDTLARRLATGLGYTWAWPDGAVTPVAHYPVGYPALLAAAYTLLGARPAAALLLHSGVGAVGAAAVHVVAGWGGPRRVGRWAGLAVALHPGLLAYTPAFMTEGVCSALLALPFAVALATRDAAKPAWRWLGVLLAGLLLGGACLVRPQALLLAPVLAWMARSPAQRGATLAGPALVVAGALAALVPWSARNQHAFAQPVLVSANGGWNLLIGTDAEARGGWRALEPPEECRGVWGEAAKDTCFGRAARRRILDHPAAWLGLAPAKLAATFDLGGSGPSYLSRSRPDLVPRWLVLALGGIETAFERVAVLVALLLLGREAGHRPRSRRALSLASCGFLALRHAWPAYVGLTVLLAASGRKRLADEPVRLVALGVLASTLVTHAVFFGAGRYALLVAPWTAAIACLAVSGALPPGRDPDAPA